MSSIRKVTEVGRKVLTVGVSGVTCGGKSSITNLLKKKYPQATFICQDDFYFPEAHSLPVIASDGSGRVNWDTLDSIDMDSMTKKARATLNALSNHASPSKRLLIIDGFLIFNYAPLAELCDLKYFITLPFEECHSRRRKRNYIPPDPEGYFVDIAWPMYLAHLKEMRESSFADKIQYLNGTLSLEENLKRILRDMQTYLDDM